MTTHRGIAGRWERMGLVIALVAAGLCPATTQAEERSAGAAPPAAAAPAPASPAPAPASPAPPAAPPPASGAAPAPAAAPALPMPWGDVPHECFNADGSVNQAALVGWQKKRVDDINQQHGNQLRMTESEHFLFLTGLDGEATSRFGRWGEVLYDFLFGDAGLEPKERAWDGKCLVLLPATQAQGADYGRSNLCNAKTSGYALEMREPGHQPPRLVRLWVMGVVFPEDTMRRQMLARQTAQAFLDLHWQGRLLPEWLRTTFPHYLSAACSEDNQAGSGSWYSVLRRLEAGQASPTFLTDTQARFNSADVPLAFTMIDFLVKTGKPKFGSFLRLLKEGKEQEKALRTAYDVGPEEIVERWKAYAADKSKKWGPLGVQPLGPPAGTAEAPIPTPRVTPLPPVPASRSPHLADTLLMLRGPCFNPDGSLNQEGIIEFQKKRLDTINKGSSLRLSLTETPHFLIFSNADAATTGLHTKWCELLYNNLCDQFGIDRKERVWDGKCILLLFLTRLNFLDYGDRFDNGSATASDGYFVWENLEPHDKMPQLAHICLFVEGHSPARMRCILAHEGTHAFFALFHRGQTLPTWLDEGLAEYMTVVNDPSLGPEKWMSAKGTVNQGISPDDILAESRNAPVLTAEGYAAAYTMVDCLLKAGGSKFKQFVILLKEGKDQDTAMQTVYGYDRAGFRTRWQKFVAGSRVSKPR